MLWLNDYSKLLRISGFANTNFFGHEKIKEIFILLFNNFVFIIFSRLIRNTFWPQLKFLFSNQKKQFVLQKDSVLANTRIQFDKDMTPEYVTEEPSKISAQKVDFSDLNKFKSLHGSEDIIEYIKLFRRAYCSLGQLNYQQKFSGNFKSESTIFYKMNLEDLILFSKDMFSNSNKRQAISQNLILDSYLVLKYLSNFQNKNKFNLKTPFDKYILFYSGLNYERK
jgi:hypothetical protein